MEDRQHAKDQPQGGQSVDKPVKTLIVAFSERGVEMDMRKHSGEQDVLPLTISN